MTETSVWEKTVAQAKSESIRLAFPKGCQVKLSWLGSLAVRHQAESRVGSVVGYGREEGMLMVLWEGRKRFASWHRDYVERCEEEEAMTPRCETCRFFDLEQGVRYFDGERIIGNCRRYAPRHVSWPALRAGSWCGEWQERKTGDATPAPCPGINATHATGRLACEECDPDPLGLLR